MMMHDEQNESMQNTCAVCAFNNPRGTVSAVIIRDGKLLLLKRATEPFKGMWDFPGGYMDARETPLETVRREVSEELGVESRADFIGWFPGTGPWQGKEYPILNHAYLIEIKDEIRLDTQENVECAWVPLQDANDIAFDSNKKIIAHVKEKFMVDFATVQNLVGQLDASAHVLEMNLYRAMLNGYVSKKMVDGKLVGLGWIFPRQTLLRRQAVAEDMIVDESMRGKGFGKEILLDLLRWAKENDMEMVELTSGSHRIPANELYKKVGFQLHPTNHYLYKV